MSWQDGPLPLVLDLLAQRNDYVLFSGFAAWILTGVEPSPDVDVFFETPAVARSIEVDLVAAGWVRCGEKGDGSSWLAITVGSGGMTVDLCWSSGALHHLFPGRIRVAWSGREFWCLEREALFLMKMRLAALEGRTDEKRHRDVEVVRRLVDVVDVRRVQAIASVLPPLFWRTGLL